MRRTKSSLVFKAMISKYAYFLSSGDFVNRKPNKHASQE